MKVQQGDLWYTDLGEPVGSEQGFSRPTLVISNDNFNASGRRIVLAVPLTTRERPGWQVHVPISAEGTGLHQDSWAMVQQFRTISFERLRYRIGEVPHDSLDEIIYVLGQCV